MENSWQKDTISVRQDNTQNGARGQCRICLSLEDVKYDILTNVIELDEGELKSFSEVYEDAAGISIFAEQNVTTLVCGICTGRLKNAALLRRQAQETYKKLIHMTLISQNDTDEQLEKEQSCSSVKTEKRTQSDEDDDVILVDDTQMPPKKMKSVPNRTNTFRQHNAVSTNGTKDLQKAPLIKISKVRKKTKRYKCLKCDKIYATKELCTQHCLKKHQTSLPTIKSNTIPIKTSKFCCHICNVQTSDINNFRHHIRNHLAKSYKCSICNASFTSLEEYTAHRESHKIPCKICKETLNTADDVKRHMQDHSILCEICSVIFYSTEELTIHMKSHPNTCSFVCETCGKRFSNQIDFKKHSPNHVFITCK